MATAGSAERPPSPGTAAARPAAGAGSSPPETEARRCCVCAEGESPPACPLCSARRPSSSEQRVRRRSDPERSSSRRDCDSRREFFLSPALLARCPDVSPALGGKHKLLTSEDRDEVKRRRDDSVRHDEEPGVLSDSENEEPTSRRIRNISAFFRRTKTCSSFIGSQRSQSCTDSLDSRGGKLKAAVPSALMDRVGISHSFTAGILLSSENSRSISTPITIPERRLTWRPVISSSSSSSAPLALPRPERSISPESNDSISEELNHFKPIVCSPCTPPKRLPDGRLMEPTIVKSTPRNLTRGLQKATSYEASPAVLQKWRQIELDRQSLKVNSKATLTTPVNELHKNNSGEDCGGGLAKTYQPPTVRDGEGLTAINRRRLLFEPPVPDSDIFHKQSVKIWVPAIRYSSEATFKGGSDSTPESCSGGGFFSRRQSFSPCTRNSGFQSCKLVPKDSQSPRKESDRNQSTSRRGLKREQKTKHLDADMRRSQEAFEDRYVQQVQQERRDRALALKLQRQFDLEKQAVSSRESPDAYFLRSWMSNQNRRRCGLRRSRRISKKH